MLHHLGADADSFQCEQSMSQEPPPIYETLILIIGKFADYKIKTAFNLLTSVTK